MFYQEKNNTIEALLTTVSEKGFDGMGEAIQILMNEAMKIERNRFLGAMPYERHSGREGYANGFKDKTVKIADFGFAKRITSNPKETVNVGSPLYMSP